MTQPNEDRPIDTPYVGTNRYERVRAPGNSGRSDGVVT